MSTCIVLLSYSGMASSKRSTENGGPGPSTKRPKYDKSLSMDDEIAFLESVVKEEATGSVGSSQPSNSQSSQRSQKNKWNRPPPPPIDPATDSITFQQIDIDHYIGSTIPGMPGAQSGSVPIVRMFGVTMEGNSVCAHIHGFLPYFYVPAPSDSFRDEHCAEFRSQLSRVISDDTRAGREGGVLAVEICQKSSIYGYHFNKMFPFLKITVSTPKLIASARRLVNSVNLPTFKQVDYQSFESNIEYEIRFMVDADVVGCNWIECPAGKYTLRKPSTSGLGVSPTNGFTTVGDTRGCPISMCQIELDISWEDFVSHAAEGDWQKIAPLRILSFDIECAGRKGIFPEAEK